MVLVQAVKGRVVREQLIGVRIGPVRSGVISVSKTGAPVTRVVISGLQTTLRRRFPFVLCLHLDTLFQALTVLVLVKRIFVFFFLLVVGQHVKSEMVVRAAHVEFMLVHLECVVERRISARVTTGRQLVAVILAQRVAGSVHQQVRAVRGVAHLEYLRITHHTESRHSDHVAFRYAEIQSSAGEDTAAAVRLMTFLIQVTHDQTRVQLRAAFAVQVIAVRITTAVADVVAVSDVEIAVYRTGVEVDVKTYVGAGRHVPWRCQGIVDTGAYGAVETRRAVAFHHQVDDTRRTFRTVFGGRIGDDFYLLNRSGRHLLEHLTAVVAVQSGRLTVDPDLHVLAVTQTDISFLIHFHRRDVLQHVRYRCTRRCDVLIHGEHFLIELEAHRTTLSDDLDVLQHLAVLAQRKAHLYRFAGYRHFAFLLAVAHKRHHERVRAVG